jgi:transposase
LAKKLASFSGLVPSSKDSGGRIKRGKITRAGSKILRWILYEATLKVNPKWGNLYQFYQRIAKKGSKKKARVALARKLLCLCYCLLKERRYFSPDNYLLKISEAQPRELAGLLKDRNVD